MDSKTDKRYIGLTGSIGTGKSTVAGIFAELGCTVLDADRISREALNPGTSCYEKTVARFGRDILREDGTVNRKQLASIIFSDSSAREDLNGIVHPFVRETMLALARQAPKDRLVVFDVPLLFESHMESMTDFNICVISDEEQCVARVIGRDSTDAAAVRARIAAQMPQQDKTAMADAVIENNGTLTDLWEQTKSLFERLSRRAGLVNF